MTQGCHARAKRLKSGSAKPATLCAGWLKVALTALIDAEVAEYLFNVHSAAGPGGFSALFAGHLTAHNNYDIKCPYI
jgi:hypothetical protein